VEKRKSTSSPLNISLPAFDIFVEQERILCGYAVENFDLSILLFPKKKFSITYPELVHIVIHIMPD